MCRAFVGYWRHLVATTDTKWSSSRPSVRRCNKPVMPSSDATPSSGDLSSTRSITYMKCSTTRLALWLRFLQCFSMTCRRLPAWPLSSPVSIQTQSFAFRALCALLLDGNRAKCNRLRWQAANHGCHCFDRTSYWLLLGRPHKLSTWQVFFYNK